MIRGKLRTTRNQRKKENKMLEQGKYRSKEGKSVIVIGVYENKVWFYNQNEGPQSRQGLDYHLFIGEFVKIRM
jgi:hypothetical protein